MGVCDVPPQPPHPLTASVWLAYGAQDGAIPAEVLPEAVTAALARFAPGVVATGAGAGAGAAESGAGAGAGAAAPEEAVAVDEVVAGLVEGGKAGEELLADAKARLAGHEAEAAGPLVEGLLQRELVRMLPPVLPRWPLSCRTPLTCHALVLLSCPTDRRPSRQWRVLRGRPVGGHAHVASVRPQRPLRVSSACRHPRPERRGVPQGPRRARVHALVRHHPIHRRAGRSDAHGVERLLPRYDKDVIPDTAFLKWKGDYDDETEGRQKAIFQVRVGVGVLVC